LRRHQKSIDAIIFQQHAEHYTRLLSEAQRELNERREQQQQQQPNNNNGNGNGQQNNAQQNSGGQQPQPQPQQQGAQASQAAPTSEMMPQLPISDGSEPQPDVGGLTTFGDEVPQEPVDLVATPESAPAKPKRAPRKRTPRKPAAEAKPVEEAGEATSAE